MNQVKKRSNIEEVEVSFFGKILELEMPAVEKGHIKYKVPFEVEFNSSWKITHTCGNCNKEVSFGKDYETHVTGYTGFNDMDSEKYKPAFLKNIVSLFKNLKLEQVNGIYYINRVDFEYVSDLQRMTSVSPVLYTCPNCKTDYLARFIIGDPVAPEKGIPNGYTGEFSVDEIVQIEKADCKSFLNVMGENKI
jgi:hypothetical protein